MHRTATVTADDFGLTPSATRSILDAADGGRIDQVSVIANGYAVEEAVTGWAARKDRLLLALHLNLTEGKALLPHSELPHLTKRDGSFRYSPMGFFLRTLLMLPPMRARMLDEVMRECRAQRALVRAYGGAEPMGIDGHMHIHMVPVVFEAILRIHEEEPWARIRLPREPFVRGEPLASYVGIRLLHHFGLRVASRYHEGSVRALGISSREYYLGVFRSGKMTLGFVRRGLSAVRRKGGDTVEIGLHPGCATPTEIESWSGDRAWHVSPWREKERVLATDPEFKNAIASFEEGTLEARPRKSIARFLVAGVIATATNLGLLYLFTDVAGIWYLASMFLAYGLATIVGFALQKFWAFADRSTDRAHVEFAAFLLNNALGVAFDAAALFLLVEYAGVWYLLAQFIALSLIATWNFFVYRFLFSKKA